ncbi:tuberin [Cydia pomonella]|uniref:tuberin n=1 Tax=Cydia pomonella TaxID=82600 RepID=UPI002ADDFDE5|nr:tuberin [Cydia pomonella]
MSSRDRDTKSLQDKLKVFFKKGASAPLPAVNELVVTADLERELRSDAAPARRLRALRDLGDRVRVTRIQQGGAERLWALMRDLLDDSCAESRHTALWFLRCIAEGQECAVMRTLMFRYLRETHALHPAEDAPHRLSLLSTLTNAGKNIECFEEQIGEYLLEYMRSVGETGPALPELLALVINVVKYNATYLDEHVVHGIVDASCHLCAYSAEAGAVVSALALLEAVVAYSLLPRAALPAFVGALCRTVNLERHCQTSWKLMRSVLGADLGHAALQELAALPAAAAAAAANNADANNAAAAADAGAVRGAVFYINMALWGPRRVPSLRVSLLCVLPALLQAVSTNQPVVTYEVIQAIQSLVTRAPPDSLCAAWDVLLAVLAHAHRHDKSLDPPNELIHTRLHALLTSIEQLHEAGQYSGDPGQLLDLIDSSAQDRPEASVLRLISLRCATLSPARADWLGAALALGDKFVRRDARAAVRLHALAQLLAVVKRHRFLYEEEVVAGVGVPALGWAAAAEPALRAAAARAAAELAVLLAGDAATDLIDLLEKCSGRAGAGLGRGRRAGRAAGRRRRHRPHRPAGEGTVPQATSSVVGVPALGWAAAAELAVLLAGDAATDLIDLLEKCSGRAGAGLGRGRRAGRAAGRRRRHRPHRPAGEGTVPQATSSVVGVPALGWAAAAELAVLLAGDAATDLIDLLEKVPCHKPLVVYVVGVPALGWAAAAEPALRAAAARAAAELAVLLAGDAATDLIDLLEKVPCHKPLVVYVVGVPALGWAAAAEPALRAAAARAAAELAVLLAGDAATDLIDLLEKCSGRAGAGLGRGRRAGRAAGRRRRHRPHRPAGEGTVPQATSSVVGVPALGWAAAAEPALRAAAARAAAELAVLLAGDAATDLIDLLEKVPCHKPLVVYVVGVPALGWAAAAELAVLLAGDAATDLIDLLEKVPCHKPLVVYVVGVPALGWAAAAELAVLLAGDAATDLIDLLEKVPCHKPLVVYVVGVPALGWAAAAELAVLLAGDAATDLIDLLEKTPTWPLTALRERIRIVLAHSLCSLLLRQDDALTTAGRGRLVPLHATGGPHEGQASSPPSLLLAPANRPRTEPWLQDPMAGSQLAGRLLRASCRGTVPQATSSVVGVPALGWAAAAELAVLLAGDAATDLIDLLEKCSGRAGAGLGRGRRAGRAAGRRRRHRPHRPAGEGTVPQATSSVVGVPALGWAAAAELAVLLAGDAATDLIDLLEKCSGRAGAGLGRGRRAGRAAGRRRRHRPHRPAGEGTVPQATSSVVGVPALGWAAAAELAVLLAGDAATDLIDLLEKCSGRAGAGLGRGRRAGRAAGRRRRHRPHRPAGEGTVPQATSSVVGVPALGWAAAAELAVLLAGDAATDLIDLLEKIMNRPFESEEPHESDPEPDLTDVTLAVSGLLEVFHAKLLRAPAAHAARACLVLLDHLDHALNHPRHSAAHAPCRKKILDMIFGLRANAFNSVGFCYDSAGSPVYGAAALRIKPLCSPSLLAEPLAARGHHPPPSSHQVPVSVQNTHAVYEYMGGITARLRDAKFHTHMTAVVSQSCSRFPRRFPSPLCNLQGTCILPVGRCARILTLALSREKEWSVLQHVLWALPALLQSRALCVGRRAQDLDLLASTLCAMLSDRSLAFPECLRGQKVLVSELHAAVLPSLGALAPYHAFLEPLTQQRVVRCLLRYGMVLRTPAPYLAALTQFTLEARDTMVKLLPEVLLDLSKVSDTKLIAGPMLEFLSTLTRLPRVFASFVEDQYMSVFAILLPYTNPSRYNHYVVSLAHHVVAAWFLKCRLSYRRNFVRFIIHGLHNYIIMPFEEQLHNYKVHAPANEDSSNRKRSSSLGSRGVSAAPIGSGSGATRAGAASASAAFHVELTETCVDLLARYTASACSVKPQRSDAAEWMFSGGQSMTWLVGHKLVTITTAGCNMNSIKQGMCDRCAALCRAHADSAASPLPPLAPPDDPARPVPPSDGSHGNHNNLQVTNPPEIKRYSKHSLQHSRSTDNSASSSLSDRPDTVPSRQNSAEYNPIVEALNNFTQRFEKISKEVDTEEAAWSRAGELAAGACPCWCADWAEIHVRSPSGDVSWLMRVQNQMGWESQESSLQDILALLAPAPSAPPSSASSGIGDDRANHASESDSRSRSGSSASQAAHAQDLHKSSSDSVVAGERKPPHAASHCIGPPQQPPRMSTQPINIPGSPVRAAHDDDMLLYVPEGKSRHPVRRSNSSPEMSSWKLPRDSPTTLEPPAADPSLLILLPGTEPTQSQSLHLSKKANKKSDMRVSCEAIPEEMSGSSPLAAPAPPPPHPHLMTYNSDPALYEGIDYARVVQRLMNVKRVAATLRIPLLEPLAMLVVQFRIISLVRVSILARAGKHQLCPLVKQITIAGSGSAPEDGPSPTPIQKVASDSIVQGVAGAHAHRPPAAPRAPAPAAGPAPGPAPAAAGSMRERDDLPPLSRSKRSNTISVMSPTRRHREQSSTPPTSSGGRAAAGGAGGGVTPSFVLLQLYHKMSTYPITPPVPGEAPSAQNPLAERPLLVAGVQHERTIKNLDRVPPIETYKVGVLYVGPGQQDNEVEVLKNEYGSVRYAEFLGQLGTLVSLAGSGAGLLEGAQQQPLFLNLEQGGKDGKYTYVWHDDIMQVLFHVATAMPVSAADPTCNEKRKYIGNDYVSIVYNDSGGDFPIQTIKGQFNLCIVVVEPCEHSLHRVHIKTKDERIRSKFLPHLEQCAHVVSDHCAATLARQLALHCALASHISQSLSMGGGSQPYASNSLERLRHIKRLRRRVEDERLAHAARAPKPYAPQGDTARRVAMDDFNDYT